MITSQIHRGTSGLDALSIPQRLVMISGISGLPNINATTDLAVGLAVGLAVLAALVYLTTWRRRSRLDWFILVATVIVVLGMFSSPEFYDHYAYFPAAFLALLLAVCISQLVGWVRQGAAHFGCPKTRLGRNRPFAVFGVSIVAVALVVRQDTTYAASYLSSSSDPAALVEAQVPGGSCVVFDYAILAINADRFNPAKTGCPATVDPFGMWLSRDDGQPPPASPPYPAAFSAAWQRWFEEANYVLLSVELSDYIPWTPELISYFNHHFVLVASEPRTYVYRRSDGAQSAATNALRQPGRRPS